MTFSIVIGNSCGSVLVKLKKNSILFWKFYYSLTKFSLKFTNIKKISGITEFMFLNEMDTN